jgi:arabinofuranosyltransferase
VTEHETRHSHLEWSLIVGLVILALLARLVPGERTVDDAYITFRYARNIVEGVGFVYNPPSTGSGHGGERVLGTTTPLYTLLMAGVSLATGSHDFPAMALIVNALAGAFSVGMLYALGKRFIGHPAPAAAVALLWAVAPHSVAFAIGGMETDLTIALLIAAAHTHVSDHPRALAALTALALLARPDTAILLGLLWLDATLARRRFLWREGLIALALLAPWLAFGALTFGNPLTASVAAKSAAYRLPPEADLIRLLQHYATPFFEHETLPPVGVFIAFALYCGLCALGGLVALRRSRRAWPLIAYPFVYFAIFAAANPLLFRWYLSPPMPFYFLLIITGAWTASRDIGKLVVSKLVNWEAPRSPIYQFTKLPFTVFTAAALVLTLNAWELHPDHGPDRPAPKMAWFKLELLYKQAADVVLSHAAPGDTLCAGDIGMLGYRTNLHVLDTVGLVTPEVSRYYPADPSIYVINYAIPADLVLALDPDYIVILEVYGRKSLLPDPRFHDRYQLLTKIEARIYQSDGMLIFKRAAQ